MKIPPAGNPFLGGVFLFRKENWGMLFSGAAAGAVNGLFGAAGGMLLVPMLTRYSSLKSDEIFPASVAIIFPICILSLFLHLGVSGLPLNTAWPYLFGGIGGGFLALRLERKIPTIWLHRILGAVILWGGIRYLC